MIDCLKFIVIILFFNACATIVDVGLYSNIERNNVNDAITPEVFFNRSQVRKNIVEVGQISVSDSGFSVNCSFEQLVYTVQKEAARHNVDGAYFEVVTEPNFQSTCYLGTARLFVYSDNNSSASNPNEINDKTEESGTIGTAFLISPEGYVVTNFHVVENLENIKLRSESSYFNAEVIVVDKVDDLAILKIADNNWNKRQKISFGFKDSEYVKLGEEVVTLGYPLSQLLGESIKLTTGNISSLNGLRGDTNQFQTTTQIQPGNSGGPLIDEFGNIVGIVTSSLSSLKLLKAAGTTPQNVNFAIKSNVVKRLLMVQGINATIIKSKLAKKLNAVEIVERFKSSVFAVSGIQDK